MRLAGGRVEVYHGQPGWSDRAGRARGDRRHAPPDGIPGRTFEMLVAGDSRKAACAAAHTVAADPTAIAHAYAVALDANGAVLAVAGRP